MNQRLTRAVFVERLDVITPVSLTFFRRRTAECIHSLPHHRFGCTCNVETSRSRKIECETSSCLFCVSSGLIWNLFPPIAENVVCRIKQAIRREDTAIGNAVGWCQS